MTEDDMKIRTKKMALRIVKMVDSLPKKRAAFIFGDQVLRSATSTASNYRAACRAKSTADFIYKLGLVEEESDETEFWLEMIVDAGLLPVKKLENLRDEVNQITKIVTASRMTAGKNRRKR